MIFEKNYLPQFRESDRDGLVGLRGFLYYFQDMATEYMHNIHKGNDTLPEEYGMVWMYTKYRLQLLKRVDFSERVNMKTWIPAGRLGAVVHQKLSIERNGELCAYGILESCVYHPAENRLVRLKEIEFPEGIQEARELPELRFQRLQAETEERELAYVHRVRYTDLDKTGHMTNLKYVDLFLNAFDSAFYERTRISGFELHFLDQCFEGEDIRVYRKQEEQKILLTAVHGDGKPCAAALMEISG